MIYPYKTTYTNGRKIDEHRLIMEQHIGRKLSRQEVVHHINGDKRDNRLENLQIMTQDEHNKLHKEYLPKTKICIECGKEFTPPTKHRGRNTICSKECHYKMKLKPIIQYDLNNNIINIWESTKEAANHYNFDRTAITKCLKGLSKTSYGYGWKYE